MSFPVLPLTLTSWDDAGAAKQSRQQQIEMMIQQQGVFGFIFPVPP